MLAAEGANASSASSESAGGAAFVSPSTHAAEGATGDITTSAASEPDSEGATGEGAMSAAAANDRARTEPSPALAPVRMAELGGIRAPLVEPPPLAALNDAESVRQQTGMDPSTHHGRVRMAVQHVEQAARQAQQDVVWRLRGLTNDTRFSIDQLADQVPRLVQAAIGAIDAAIESACSDVERASNEEQQRVRDAHVDGRSDFEANRERAVLAVHTELLRGSDEIEQAKGALQAEFTRYLSQAQGAMRAIPDSGTVVPLPVPRPATAPPDVPAAPAESGPRTYAEAQRQLDEQLNQPASGRLARVTDYVNTRKRAALPELVSPRAQAARRANEARANALGEDGVRADFANVSLGIISPLAADAEGDARGDEARVNEEVRRQDGALGSARQQIVRTIRLKARRVTVRLRGSLRTQLVDGLHKLGRSAQKALREQARTAENELAAMSAPAAQAQRDLVDRLTPLLPAGQLLDARDLTPRLQEAARTAAVLRRDHIESATQRSADSLSEAKRRFEAQAEQIAEMGESAAQSERDAATGTIVDLSLEAGRATGTLSQGVLRSVDRIRDYVHRQAQNLLRVRARVQENGLTPLQDRALSFLNGTLRAEVARFVAGAGRLGEMIAPDFTQIARSEREDVSRRADALNTAMPLPDPMAGLDPVSALIDLYRSNADEGKVIEQLGDIPWPGPLAIADEFSDQHHGSLRDRIDQRMSEPERTRALGLLSASVGRRAEARIAIARDDDSSRAGREAALRNLSPDERVVVRDRGWIEGTRSALRSELTGTDLTISEAYLDDNTGRALSARMEQELAQAHSADEVQAASRKIEELAQAELRGQHRYVGPAQIEQLTRSAFREFSSLPPRTMYVRNEYGHYVHRAGRARSVPRSSERPTQALAPSWTRLARGHREAAACRGRSCRASGARPSVAGESQRGGARRGALGQHGRLRVPAR
jgi:hypothetical protein